MKIYWEQLSPRERETLLRHFLLQRRNEPVTAEGVCAALRKTHSLSCHSSKEGKLVFRFVNTHRGARTGASQADEFSEGIYKAALRAKGIDVEDGLASGFVSRRSSTSIARTR